MNIADIHIDIRVYSSVHMYMVHTVVLMSRLRSKLGCVRIPGLRALTRCLWAQGLGFRVQGLGFRGLGV